MQNKKLVIIFTILCALWLGVIFAFSNASSLESDSESKGIVRYIVETFNKDKSNSEINKIVNKLNKPFRKIAHFTVYLILAILLSFLILNIKSMKLSYYNIICILSCFLYACSDEIHQLFIIGRTGQFTDVLIDTLGAICGCAIFNYIYHKYYQ